MTIAQLTAKRDALLQQKEQALANINALVGAIQLLDELVAEERNQCASAPPGSPAQDEP